MSGMEPGVSEIIASCTGICQSVDETPLPDGSGFTFHRDLGNGLAEYYISSSEGVFDTAITEMLAKGLTITFPPEPDPVVEEEVPIA